MLTTTVNAADLVSVNLEGSNSGNGGSMNPQISADGRFVVFDSMAKDLVATSIDNNPNTFVRNLVNGTTSLVSINRAGTGSGNEEFMSPRISADGRFVIFTSNASDLVAADTNGTSDVFVRDLVNDTTTLVSVNGEGGSTNGSSGNPQISPDGRFVIFTSNASDLVAADTNGTSDVFVRDLVNDTTTLVSVNEEGTGSANGFSGSPQISPDGRFVAFVSYASDLVGKDTNGTYDVFVRDLVNGTTTLVSVNRAGTDSGNDDSYWPKISADGRFVAFVSYASDLVDKEDTNGKYDVFVRDLVNGTTTLVSVNRTESGSGNNESWNYQISADGRFVAFQSWASDLVATDTNGMHDIFMRDLVNGTTTLVTINRAGTDSGNRGSGEYQISADGRFVAFVSHSSDLVATDTNGTYDVFVRDLVDGITTLVSVNKEKTGSSNAGSGSPRISADGRIVAFASFASDLVSMDTNGKWDVFISKAFTICNCADAGAIKGTIGPDILFGTPEADIICGFGGNDAIAGLGGDDCIDGGEGNDLIIGGIGDDNLFGSGGNDVLFGIFGDDTMDGGEGYDWVFGGQGTDVCIGDVVKGCEN